MWKCIYVLHKALQLQQRERHKYSALNFWGIGFRNNIFYMADTTDNRENQLMDNALRSKNGTFLKSQKSEYHDASRCSFNETSTVFE